MAAEVKHVLACPRCQEHIISTTPVLKCPKCEFPLGARPGGSELIPPHTLTEQKIKSNTSDFDMFEMISDLSIDKACSIMNDALLIVETLPGKKTELSGIRPLVEMAIRIGKLAEAYDAFLQAGGKHTPTIIIKHQDQKQEKKNESAQEGTGGKSPPAPIFENTN